MRFHSRDSLSPFGKGGLNGYAYCAGDPVNRIDPSGHAWTDWLLPAAGLALALVGTVASLGALAAPAAAMTASYVAAVTTATLSVVSLAADVASMTLLATGNENAGRILGYVGMATGLASAAPSIASAAAKKVKHFGMGVGKLQGRLQHAGAEGRGFLRRLLHVRYQHFNPWHTTLLTQEMYGVRHATWMFPDQQIV